MPVTLVILVPLLGVVPLAARDYAFLVGVGDYEPKQLTRLEYADDDVTALVPVLRARGYRERDVVLLTLAEAARRKSLRFAPQKRSIITQLDLLLATLGPEDSLLVVFSGHGVQFKGSRGAYFCPADADLENVASLISLESVFSRLGKAKARRKLLLVDACRKNPASRFSWVALKDGLESVTRPQSIDPSGGTVAFYSCAGGEEAFEDSKLGSGVFLHYVRSVLEAKGGDANRDGRLSLGEFCDYVSAETTSYVRDRFGALQRPTRRGEVVGSFVIPGRPGEAPPGTSPAGGLSAYHVDIRHVYGVKGLPDLRSTGYTLLGPNAQRYPEYRHERTGIVFVLLPGGTFDMGSPAAEAERYNDEGPVHRVRLSPFLIAKHEVTQAEWKREMGTSPSRFEGDDLPVEQVSWDDCREFCEKTGLSLPTEAQWEYACRAGKRTPFSFGATITPEEVNYDGNFPYGNARKGLDRQTTVAVGSLPANGFGLHEMHGNVWEWCQDVYDAKYYSNYSKSASRNGDKACTSGSGTRVYRGGSWYHFARRCRSAYRIRYRPSYRLTLGFRPSRSSP